MRFSKAPLIATLMAVALSLLIILPALAENSIKTDGQLIKGEAAGDRVAVGVFSDALDAQYDWQAFETGDESLSCTRQRGQGRRHDGNTASYRRGSRRVRWLPTSSITLRPMRPVGATTDGDITTHPADPRNTFFGGTLYVSNELRCLQHGADQCAEVSGHEATVAFDSDAE